MSENKLLVYSLKQIICLNEKTMKLFCQRLDLTGYDKNLVGPLYYEDILGHPAIGLDRHWMRYLFVVHKSGQNSELSHVYNLYTVKSYQKPHTNICICLKICIRVFGHIYPR